ncbi:uncharacterized protein LOC133285370 [Gastrolobium bilobum]|uniref:uncharacterized protein LOC133285370 n=1 Tax=Gastrolobium bilobum TaxID=150636 RepID=UPI002AAFDC63|nr:uncharacterized protein LOC133285370 [Gastrolobium bilobum]
MEEVVNNDNNGNHNHKPEQGPNEGRGPSLNDMAAPFRNGPERGLRDGKTLPPPDLVARPRKREPAKQPIGKEAEKATDPSHLEAQTGPEEKVQSNESAEIKPDDATPVADLRATKVSEPVSVPTYVPPCKRRSEPIEPPFPQRLKKQHEDKQFSQSFLATGDAIINVRKGELSMSVNGEEVKFNVMKAIKFDEDNTEECSSISILDSVIRDEQQEHLQPEIGMKDFEELEEYLASISFHQPQGRKERRGTSIAKGFTRLREERYSQVIPGEDASSVASDNDLIVQASGGVNRKGQLQGTVAQQEERAAQQEEKAAQKEERVAQQQEMAAQQEKKAQQQDSFMVIMQRRMDKMEKLLRRLPEAFLDTENDDETQPPSQDLGDDSDHAGHPPVWLLYLCWMYMTWTIVHRLF